METNMKNTKRNKMSILGILLAGALSQPFLLAAADADTAKLLGMLPTSKLTLAQGIEQAAAKSPEVAISAKFEIGDDGKLALSVYTAERGSIVTRGDVL